MTWSERLQSELAAKGWSKAELSRRSGVPYDSVNKYLRGSIDQPRGDTIDKLAAALGVDPLWLKEGVARDRVMRGLDVAGFIGADVARLPIRGEVAAGRWLETPALLQLEEITDFVEGMAVAPGLSEWTYGLKVRGTSINKLAVDGDVLVCLDVMSGVEFAHRDLVIVERVRDQGALREVTAKRLIRRDGRFHLMPESTDPMWQNEIEIGEDVPQDDSETRLIAKVKHIIKPVG
jgi:transcriptional regulator with XRE-family HTH domain